MDQNLFLTVSHMHYFTNLDTIIDDVHSLFDALEKQLQESPTLPLEALHTAKMAVHEWIANLIQHSNFESRSPQIGVCLSQRDERLFCIIEDNSKAFDLNGYLDNHEGITQAFPDRGMGLLLLKACTEELCYKAIQEGKNQLEFYITDKEDTFLEIPFHD